MMHSLPSIPEHTDAIGCNQSRVERYRDCMRCLSRDETLLGFCLGLDILVHFTVARYQVCWEGGCRRLSVGRIDGPCSVCCNHSGRELWPATHPRGARSSPFLLALYTTTEHNDRDLTHCCQMLQTTGVLLRTQAVPGS